MLTGVTGLFCVDRCYRTVLCCQVLQDCSVLTGVTGLFPPAEGVPGGFGGGL